MRAITTEGASAPSNVLCFAAARAKRLTQANAQLPTWAHDIKLCCAYAELLKAQHQAESASIRFDQLRRGLGPWWEGPSDIRDRVNENNRQWDIYCALIRHIAALPAANRREAAIKRSAIGRKWLSYSGEQGWITAVRAGCVADDHLFPPSLKLGRA
ncbi:MAG TPA: hypothetical protein VM346_01170 [Sphingomicrobium sp.]|nr:hypothetical protein [Sphingomicrobium sp.]